MRKNKWLAFLLAFVVSLSMIVPGMNVSAAGPEEVYPVFFGETQIDSLNKDDVLRDGSGRVSYDPGTHTLYLRNYENPDNEPDHVIKVDPDSYQDLTIDLSGDNVLVGSERVGTGIDAHSSEITIKSSDGTGSLQVAGEWTGISACNLIIESGRVFTYGENYGILLEQNFTMNSGYLSARGNAEAGIATYIEGDQGAFTINGGKSYFYGGLKGIACDSLLVQGRGSNVPLVYADAECYGVYAVDGITADHCYLEATSVSNDVYGDGIHIRNESGILAIDSSTIKAEGTTSGIQTGSLTMTNGDITANGGVDCGIMASGNISFKSGTVNCSGGNYGIYCVGSLSIQELGDNAKTEIYAQGIHYGVYTGGDTKVYGGYLNCTTDYENGSISGDGLYSDADVYMEGGVIDAAGETDGINTENLWMNAGEIWARGTNASGIFARGEIDVTGGKTTAAGGTYGILANSDIIFYEGLTYLHAEGTSDAVLTKEGFLSSEVPITYPAKTKVSEPYARYFVRWEGNTGYPVKSVTLKPTAMISYDVGEGQGRDFYVDVPVGTEVDIAAYPDEWSPPEGQHFTMWLGYQPWNMSFLAEQVDKGFAKYTAEYDTILVAQYGYWITHYADTSDISIIRYVNAMGEYGSDQDLSAAPEPYHHFEPGEKVYMSAAILPSEGALDPIAYVMSTDGAVLAEFQMEQNDSYVSPSGLVSWHGSFSMPEQDCYVAFRSYPELLPLPDTAVLSSTSVTYTGKERRPKVTIEGLTQGTDFTVTYANNINAGTGKVTITGIGRYEGSYTKTFTIKPKAVTPKISVTAATYNGKVLTPKVTVKAGTTTLTTKDYTVKFASGRKNVGSYKVTVTLKRNYSGKGTGTFKINPKGTLLTAPAASSKAITVNWKKQSAKMAVERITGYQIHLATDSKFTKNLKKVNAAGYATVSKTIKSLKGATKYYIRIRTYKKIDTTNYYSPWSAVKTVTTKK